MATTRDFASPERVQTEPIPEDRTLQPSAGSPPEAGQSPERRRGSLFSTRSSGDGMRHRSHSRTNTVTLFPDHEPPPAYNDIEHLHWRPGAEPGIDTSAEDETVHPQLAQLKAHCDIMIVDFSDTDVKRRDATNATLEAALAEPRTEDLPCRWVSVNGLSWDVIKLLGNKFNLHRLAIEDLLHTRSRTKVDWYADHAFIVMTLQKLVRLHQHQGSNEKCYCDSPKDHEADEKSSVSKQPPHSSHSRWWNLGRTGKQTEVLPRYTEHKGNGNANESGSTHSTGDEGTPVRRIRTLQRYESAQSPQHTAWMEKHSALAADNYTVGVEQVSIFLLTDNCVISFFEQSADVVEQPILDRLDSKETMLRRSCDASLLLQAIIDAIVDLAVPVKDAYNKARKELQIDAMTNPNIRTSRSLHIFGEEIKMLQNLFRPIVLLINALRDHNSEHPLVSVAPSPMTPVAPHADKTTHAGPPGLPRMMRKASDFKRIALQRADAATSATITPLAHTYFGDVLDHCITMISSLEQMDASADNISTLIFNTVGAKTNNFMMILAVVTVLFAPLTFITGYFGMNFASASGLDHPFAFFWVVGIPSLIAFTLLVFATLLWDNIRDFLARRGLRRFHHRNRKSK